MLIPVLKRSKPTQLFYVFIFCVKHIEFAHNVMCYINKSWLQIKGGKKHYNYTGKLILYQYIDFQLMRTIYVLLFWSQSRLFPVYSAFFWVLDAKSRREKSKGWAGLWRRRTSSAKAFDYQQQGRTNVFMSVTHKWSSTVYKIWLKKPHTGRVFFVDNS